MAAAMVGVNLPAPAVPGTVAGGPILHLTARLGLPGSGMARVVWNLAVAQGEIGCRSTIHTTLGCADDSLSDEALAPRPSVHVFPVTGPGSNAFSPAAERWIRSAEASGFPVLHQHGIWPAFSRVTLHWRTRLRKPSVVAPHGSLDPEALIYSRWKKALAATAYERQNLERASCLHATAHGELRHFRNFGLRNPVAILSNGVSDAWLSSHGDSDRFRAAHGLPGETRLLLYFSRVHRKKGLLTLVEAIARNPRRVDGWQLVVAGPDDDPRYFARVAAFIADHRLSNRVHMVGELRGQERRDAFAAAEMLVLPTRSENFGLVIAEALGVGVPVITTQGAVAWAGLARERAGWWVEPDLPALEEALLAATAMSKEDLAEMGARGRSLVLRNYRWETVARQTLALYSWLAGDAARPDFVVVD
jgi:glycosyltransferase involved in cell wall biosynthesis